MSDEVEIKADPGGGVQRPGGRSVVPMAELAIADAVEWKRTHPDSNVVVPCVSVMPEIDAMLSGMLHRILTGSDVTYYVLLGNGRLCRLTVAEVKP